MKIDRALVAKVADLAHLKLDDQELSHYETQLGRILGFVEQLGELKDDLGTSWRSDTIGIATLERNDLAFESLPVQQVLAQAPKVAGSAFEVPRIIE